MINYHSCRIAIVLLIAAFNVSSTARAADAELAEAARRVMDKRFRANTIQIERLWGGYMKVREHMDITGPLADALANLEAKFHEAYSSDRLGEARRAIHHAYATLNNRSFNRKEAFVASLMPHANRTVVDPANPIRAELRSLFPVDARNKDAPLRMEVNLRRIPSRPRAKPLKQLERYVMAAIGTDRPFTFEVDLAGVTEGNYQLAADLYLADRPLRRVTRPLTLAKDFETAHADFKDASLPLRATLRPRPRSSTPSALPSVSTLVKSISKATPSLKAFAMLANFLKPSRPAKATHASALPATRHATMFSRKPAAASCPTASSSPPLMNRPNPHASSSHFTAAAATRTHTSARRAIQCTGSPSSITASSSPRWATTTSAGEAVRPTTPSANTTRG